MGSINITDKAINKIQEVLKDQNMKYFRIRVKGGGVLDSSTYLEVKM